MSVQWSAVSVTDQCQLLMKNVDSLRFFAFQEITDASKNNGLIILMCGKIFLIGGLVSLIGSLISLIVCQINLIDGLISLIG